MAVGILLKYFRRKLLQLSEDSAEFRYVPLYIADQVEFRCSFYKNFTLLQSRFHQYEDYNSSSTTQKKKLVRYVWIEQRVGLISYNRFISVDAA